MILITGCGRSGTKYISKVVQTFGLDLVHEGLGTDGSVSWHRGLKTSGYPKKYAQLRPDFDLILHQVRNPLDVIISFTTATEDTWEWVRSKVRINTKLSKLGQAAEYWYYWNRLIEKSANWTYRIENLENEWKTFTSFLGLSASYSKIKAISTKTNSREHPKITWKDIDGATRLSSKIRWLACHYGYKKAEKYDT